MEDDVVARMLCAATEGACCCGRSPLGRARLRLASECWGVHDRITPLRLNKEVRQAILRARNTRPSTGPRMLAALFARRPSEFGLEAADLPSRSSIARVLHEAGLSR